MQVIINTHEATKTTANDVERKHYTVGQLIAELKQYDGDAPVIIKNLNTGNFGSIDFQGLTTTS